MPRTARVTPGGLCYHVLNRGNARAEVFHKPADYAAFLDLVGRATRRLPMPVLAYCLMPNHFHLVLWPNQDRDLSRWMQWLMTAHVRRYHSHYRSNGHLWQGRFKAFPIQSDQHLLAVLRYVERNPLRANLVARAEDWAWSSLKWWRAQARPLFLAEGPLPRPDDWPQRVNRPENAAELEALRLSAVRGAPFGDPQWRARTATRLGLQATLRPRGRPRKTPQS